MKRDPTKPHEGYEWMHSSNDGLGYDTVIFDVGGTLMGYLPGAPFQQFLAQAGLPSDEADARALQKRFATIMAANRDGAQGIGADGEEILAFWRIILAKLWPDRPDLAQEMFQWLRAGRFDQLFDDSIPALEALHDMGLRMGILSNFTSDLEGVLRRLGIRGYFDFVVVSALVGLAKPDPRIFHLAIAQAGRPRQRLLYVGDHIGDDVEGSNAAALDVVLIDRKDRQVQAACRRIRSLLELVDLVRQPILPPSTA
jgi:HAD superfamily hydrolase (TIGR01549 family)